MATVNLRYLITTHGQVMTGAVTGEQYTFNPPSTGRDITGVDERDAPAFLEMRRRNCCGRGGTRPVFDRVD